MLISDRMEKYSKTEVRLNIEFFWSQTNRELFHKHSSQTKQQRIILTTLSPTEQRIIPTLPETDCLISSVSVTI